MSSLVLNSPWRRSRLLILCYHGISLDDEHRWSPGLYVTAEQFEQRLRHLAKRNCAVLPLGEAVRRMYEGSLPSRSVTLTFDDGFYDFYERAWPVLKSFSWPVTLYLTTYYSEHSEWPVFDPACGYILWKSTQHELRWREVLGAKTWPLDTDGCLEIQRIIRQYCIRERLGGAEKNTLLCELASAAGVDLSLIRQKRILHLMNRHEAQEMASAGVDIQLHTHRHRVSAHRDRFIQELNDNGDWITAVAGRKPIHFCYPGGFRLPEMVDWLGEYGIESATTCDPGIASSSSAPRLLPRVLDTTLSDVEFDAWVTGFAALVSRKTHPMAEGQLLEE